MSEYKTGFVKCGVLMCVTYNEKFNQFNESRGVLEHSRGFSTIIGDHEYGCITAERVDSVCR